jgi:hypothetical protein
LLLGVWCATGALAACTSSSGSSDDGCPTLSTGCPASPPSWQNDIKPLVGAYCLRCHVEGGVAPPQFEYTSYQAVYQNRSEMLTQIDQCRMPPADASPPAVMPSQQERQTLVSWLACGAPDN